MLSFSPAKINLGLYITDKREDGFHNLESLFLPIKLFDAIELIPAKKNELFIYGTPIPGKTSDNSCIKTVELLQENYSISNYQIHIYKNIPMGAGLGGGSGNSALIIRMINKLENLQLTVATMRKIALKIGSDNAFFIEDEPKYVKGRGDVIENCDFVTDGLKLVLVIPDVHQSTKEAYEQVNFQTPSFSLKKMTQQDIVNRRITPENDFQNPFIKANPKTKEILSVMKNSGAIYSSLTGSGSCFFGLFKKDEIIAPNLKLFTEKKGYKYIETEFL